MSANHWLKIIQEARSGAADNVPNGWQTTAQIAESTGVSEQMTRRAMSAAIKIGRVEMKKFRIENGGRVIPVPHYKIK